MDYLGSGIGSPPQDPPVILHATPGVSMTTAIPTHSRFYGTRTLTQNEARARDAAVTRLVAEAARAASVARDLRSSELRSARVKMEAEQLKLELDDTQAEDDACILALQRKRLRGDRERTARVQKRAARDLKTTALDLETAARKQEAAVMAAEHAAQRAAEAAEAEQLRAEVESREAMREAERKAWGGCELFMRSWDDLVASRTADFEATEAAGISLLPRPMDEWMRSPPVLAPSPSVAEMSPAPAELQCEPSPSNTDQDLSQFVLLREEFPGLQLENIKFIRMMRERKALVAPDGYAPPSSASDEWAATFLLLRLGLPYLTAKQFIDICRWSWMGAGPTVASAAPPAPLVPDGDDGGDRLDGMASVGGGVRGHAGGGRHDGGWHGPSDAGDGGAGWEHQGGRRGGYRRGRGSKRRRRNKR